MSIRIVMKPKRENDTSESSRNIGTARVLYGKIYVIMIFVGPHDNPWTRSEAERYKAKVAEAEQWLKIQAAKYGKRLEFVNAAFGADGNFCDNDIPEDSDSANAYSYPSSVFLKIGFESRNRFVDWVHDNTDCDQCLSIIFSNTKGRSYASPVTREYHAYDSETYNLECCLLYRGFKNSDVETNSATVAHEILHLFGAWDLYRLDSSDSERAVKTELMFPDSIMLNTHRDIWETRIDEINAWLVGLKDEGQDWYRWFEPGQESYLT